MQPKYYGAAADYNKPKGAGLMFDKRLLMMLGLAVVVITVISIGFGLLNAAASAPKNDLQALVARENSLNDFMKTNQPGIHSQSLSIINAEAQLLVGGDTYALTAALSSQYGIDKIAAEFTAAEVDATSASALGTAAINGRFDQTYVSMLQDKLAATQTLAQKIKDGNGGDIGALVDRTIKTTQSLSKRLADLQL